MNRLARPALRALSVVGIAVAVTGMYLAPGGATKASPPAAGALPGTAVPPLGANFFLEREVEPWKREMTVKMARDAGVRWMRQMFNWEEIEPRKGYFFDDTFRKSTWEKYDEIVALAERNGMRIIARVDRPPAWTRRENAYPDAPPDDLDEYFTFIRTLVSRYQGKVLHYQIWTEPNIWPQWGTEGVNPAGYVRMLRGAYQAAKSVDPNVVILSAPLAQTLEESSRNLNELKYLDGMYQAGAQEYFDVLGANAYGFDFAPADPPDPARLNFSRLKRLREVMEQHGDGGKAVWLNEFGWNASPVDFPAAKLTWRRVSEQQQATYTIGALKLARSWGWIGVLNFWYFRQVGDIPARQSDYYFRMVDVDFTPRPVYLEVRKLAASEDGWGLANSESGPDTSPPWAFLALAGAALAGLIGSAVRWRTR